MGDMWPVNGKVCAASGVKCRSSEKKESAMKTQFRDGFKSILAGCAGVLALACSLTCPAATPTILATSTGNPGNLLVDGSSVYWVDDLTGQLHSVSITPGGTVFDLGTVASGINDFVQDTSFLYYRVNAQGFAINKVSKSGATTTTFGVDNYPLAAGSSLAIGPAGGVLYYDSDRDVPNDGVDAFLGLASISTLGGADQVLIYQDPGYAGLLNGGNSSGEAALQLDNLPYAIFGAPGSASTDSTYLYWQDFGTPENIWQMPLVGGTPEALVSGRTDIKFIATPTTGAAAGSIFWTEASGITYNLMRREVGGQIITVLTNIFSYNRCFAVDNDTVFSEQAGGLVQVSINGGAVTVISSITEVFGPGGVAVDSSYIYCGNLLGQILRIPRPSGGGGTTYTITLSASPANGGTVGGDGTFAAGSSSTVTATNSSGYTFANWTENGTVVSSSASYTFTLNGNRSLVANFTQNTANPSPLAGTWVGTWAWSGPGASACLFSDGGAFSMKLEQTSNSFSGSVSGAGIQARDSTTCALTSTGSGVGTASGTISGTALHLSFNLAGSFNVLSFTGTATLSNNTLTASFVRSTGGSGSFTVTPQTNYTITVSALPSAGG